MFSNRRFPLALGAAITIAALTQPISAMAQPSERSWLQVYAVASSAITSFVVARDAFISYTAEPTEELCTMVVRTAIYRRNEIHATEVRFRFAGSTWSTTSHASGGIEVRSSDPAGVRVQMRVYVQDGQPVVQAPSHVQGSVVYPVHQTERERLALKDALDAMIAVCKRTP